MVRSFTVIGVVCSLMMAGCGSSKSGTSASAAPVASASAAPVASASAAPVASTAAAGSTRPSSAVSSAAGSGPVVACKIVTSADVAAVFGGTVSDGVAGKTPQYCDFTMTGTLKSGKQVDAMGATVTVWWNEHALDPNSKVLNAAATVVPELGVAFYQASGKALMVAYHGGTLTYQAEGPDDDATVQTDLVALAKATMSH